MSHPTPQHAIAETLESLDNARLHEIAEALATQAPAAGSSEIQVLLAVKEEIHHRASATAESASDAELTAQIRAYIAQQPETRTAPDRTAFQAAELEIRHCHPGADDAADAFIDTADLEDPAHGQHDHLHVLLRAAGL